MFNIQQATFRVQRLTTQGIMPSVLPHFLGVEAAVGTADIRRRSEIAVRAEKGEFYRYVANAGFTREVDA